MVKIFSSNNSNQIVVNNLKPMDLNDNEKLVLVQKINEKEEKIIEFSKNNLLIIHDELIKQAVAKKSGPDGLFILPLYKGKIGRDFVPTNDPQFYDAFIICFNLLKKEFTWKKEKIDG